jgi:hypothetical protein
MPPLDIEHRVAAVQDRPPWVAAYIDHLIRWHHVAGQVIHDPDRAADEREDYQDAEGQRQHVARLPSR